LALIAAGQKEKETLSGATRRELKELGWDEDTRAPAYQKARKKAPKEPALLPRQKRVQALWLIAIVLFFLLVCGLPTILGMLGN
jgi:hypothetical protein